MAEGMMGAAPDGAASQPHQGQATGPGGATMPVANRGIEGQALARLAVHVQGMQTVLAVLPAGSDAARDIREALNKVAKHVPPGGMSQGVQMTEAQRQLMQQRQMGPQVAAMRATQGGGQPQQPPQQPMTA